MSSSPVIFHHGHGMKRCFSHGCGYGSRRALHTTHGLSGRGLLDVAMCVNDTRTADSCLKGRVGGVDFPYPSSTLKKSSNPLRSSYLNRSTIPSTHTYPSTTCLILPTPPSPPTTSAIGTASTPSGVRRGGSLACRALPSSLAGNGGG